MARPSTLTPELKAAIASSRASNPARMLAELQAAGFPISGRTLRRHLAQTQQPAAGSRFAGLELLPDRTRQTEAVARQALNALESGDDLSELQRASQDVAQARRDWAGFLGGDPRAVRAYAALSRLQVDLAKAAAELAPPPAPSPDSDPANVAAKARLLTMVDEILARTKGAA